MLVQLLLLGPVIVDIGVGFILQVLPGDIRDLWVVAHFALLRIHHLRVGGVADECGLRVRHLQLTVAEQAIDDVLLLIWPWLHLAYFLVWQVGQLGQVGGRNGGGLRVLEKELPLVRVLVDSLYCIRSQASRN